MKNNLNYTEFIQNLPSDWPEDLIPDIQNWLKKHPQTIVVLDDDPTGTQTVSNVPVLTDWNTDILIEELNQKPTILFLLTNSRSLFPEDAAQLALEVGNRLKEASIKSARQICVVSRSDSTLRGHYPLEVDALAEAMELQDAVQILIPAFFPGGRFTINDVHYVQDMELLIPAAETPFAKDASFGYGESNLKKWVEEKTNGKVKAKDVVSIPLDAIRMGGPQAVLNIIKNCLPGNICILNAATSRDLEVFTTAMYQAQESGQKFIFRTAASIIPVLAGQYAKPLIKVEDFESSQDNGGIIVVGSYVPKSSRQLEYLLQNSEIKSIEIPVDKIIESADRNQLLSEYAAQINQCLVNNENIVLYTSRTIQTGKDACESLKIVNLVSESIVKIIEQIEVTPRFFIAKGGITSSDIATKAIKAKKASAIGQILPGVPVWKLTEVQKFKGMHYVIFPGNVGADDALFQAYQVLNPQNIPQFA